MGLVRTGADCRALCGAAAPGENTAGATAAATPRRRGTPTPPAAPNSRPSSTSASVWRCSTRRDQATPTASSARPKVSPTCGQTSAAANTAKAACSDTFSQRRSRVRQQHQPGCEQRPQRHRRRLAQRPQQHGRAAQQRRQEQVELVALARLRCVDMRPAPGAHLPQAVQADDRRPPPRRCPAPPAAAAAARRRPRLPPPRPPASAAPGGRRSTARVPPASTSLDDPTHCVLRDERLGAARRAHAWWRPSASKTASSGNCRPLARWLVLAASATMASSSACCASLMPLARAAAVCECTQ